jgi:predicted ATPase/class 3 adenylate cyclase
VGVQPSGTVTLVFTDIEGSTRLLEELGRERYREALAEHRERIRAAFARFDGYEVDYEGDSFFYAFASASAAMAAVREAMTALAEGPVRVRAGIHTGEPGLDPPKYVGMDVHRAARIMACAHGGQVVVSQATRELLGQQGDLRDLGEHRLKDLSARIRLYQLGEGDFPPLRSLYRTNLPVPATVFLGRERELAEVASLLDRDQVRLLTLSGPGGTGKTRLALQAAADAADRLPDGVWWVPLAPLRDPALVLSAVGQALEVKEEPGRELAETIAARLAGKRLLLLLDNLEQLLPDAAAAIATLRDISGPLLLVTSRERLQLAGEHVYPVPALTDGDAAALFTTRARQLDPGFVHTPALATLCLRLDNLPLALELAAARTPLFTLEQLLERIAQRLDLLKGGRDADPRQQTLRATIAWSYELLEEDERRLFRRLAVFVGGCTYEAAATVCEADPDTLQSLLDKSLLRRRVTELGRRYWMLETVREFAAERLHESGEAAELAALHAGDVLEFAETMGPAVHGPRQAECLDRLEAELANVRAALESSPPEGRLRLAAALSWFWQLRNHLAEGLSWLERALREVETPTLDRARALGAAGRLTFYSGDAAAACRLLEQSAGLLQALGDGRDLAEALTYTSVTAGVVGDVETARLTGERAIGASKSAGDDWTQALALWGLGMNYILGRCGPPDASSGAPLLEESVALFRKTGDEWGLAAPLFYLGRVARAAGDLDSARRLMSESAALLREVGEIFRLNLALHGLGDMAVAQADWPAAHAFYAEAVQVSRDTGGVEWVADAQLKLALTVLGEGDPSGARQLLCASLDGYRATGSANGLLWLLEGFSHLAARSGNPERAAILLGASDARSRGGGFLLEGRERLEAELRKELGRERFEAARAEGVVMSADAAIEVALAQERDV